MIQMATGPFFALVLLTENVSPLVMIWGVLDMKYTDAVTGTAIHASRSIIVAARMALLFTFIHPGLLVTDLCRGLINVFCVWWGGYHNIRGR